MEVVELHVSGLIPAEADRLYAAWLDERDHASFTGGGPAQIEAKVGGSIVTGDGRYAGKITKLRAGTQISFTLRTPEFPQDSEDSKVTVSFNPHSPTETLIEIRHAKVPAPLGPELERHWLDHYVMPMRGFFAALPPANQRAEAEATKPKTAKKASTKKAAVKKEPTKQTDEKKAPKKKTAAKKATATKAPTKKAATKKTPAKKASTKKTPAKKAAAKKATSSKSRGASRRTPASSPKTTPATKKKTAAKKKARSHKKTTR